MKISVGTSINERTAVVQAELGGWKFACRIDSGADRNAISETAVSFLGDHGVFLPTRLFSSPEKLKAVDGHLVQSKGVTQVSPLIQTVAGPCRLRNVNVQIMEDKDPYVQPNNPCAGEIILGNPFLITSGLDVKDFLAKHFERLASIDYGDLDQEKHTAKVGKLGLKLLSQEIDGSIAEPDSSKLCSLVSNDNFPLKYSDDIDHKDVEVKMKKKPRKLLSL